MLNDTYRKQLEKPIHWFLKYFPSKIKNIGFKEDVMRNLIIDFKEGKDVGYTVSDTVSKYMNEHFDCKNLVFACVPASSPQRQELRFKDFSRRVCQQTHALNGYWHIQVMKERAISHKDKEKAEEILDKECIWYDTAYWKDKNVICFDDIITQGTNYARFATQLENMGANVLGGLFLARTHYKVDEPYGIYKE